MRTTMECLSAEMVHNDQASMENVHSSLPTLKLVPERKSSLSPHEDQVLSKHTHAPDDALKDAYEQEKEDKANALRNSGLSIANARNADPLLATPRTDEEFNTEMKRRIQQFREAAAVIGTNSANGASDLKAAVLDTVKFARQHMEGELEFWKKAPLVIPHCDPYSMCVYIIRELDRIEAGSLATRQSVRAKPLKPSRGPLTRPGLS
ncbi:hypothetical protein NM688_g276 [Phlebia brevispora]|uniref:Uncharacterized protein n=1 Tax=Phlebia brevispora TaxID=194682 RepID=A0ACC1TFI7_9APHY|nr:hypothetical protein NM688_g276 [Phlebia brevispora]